MARALWSGAITFGLVNVPVKLYQATPTDSGHGISFHRLHDKCGTRIQHRRWCPHCEQEVEWQHVISGYEFARGRYAIVKPEELPKAERGDVAAIAIEDFVHADEVDPMLFDRSYWVAPDGPARPFALLHQALIDSGRIAIARVLIRTRIHLAAVRPGGSHLVLSTMFFADEVVAESDVPAGAEGIKVAQRELELARELVEKMTRTFDAASYRDEHSQQLRELVERKIAEKEVTKAQPPEVGEGEVIDIMAALRKSIERGAAKKAEEALNEPAAPRRRNQSRAQERTWRARRKARTKGR